jgi:RNA polymerase sigma-70 factor, ECF subfamily
MERKKASPRVSSLALNQPCIEDGSKSQLQTLLPAATLATFETLYTTYRPQIYQYTLHMLGDKDDAEDVTQDVFYKVYTNLVKYDPSRSTCVLAWIYKIAKTTCIDVIRHRRVCRKTDVDPDTLPQPGADGADPERIMLQHESCAHIRDVLACLPARNRISLILHTTYGLRCDEIAPIVHTSVNNVKTILFRARQQFRNAYARHSMVQH